MPKALHRSLDAALEDERHVLVVGCRVLAVTARSHIMRRFAHLLVTVVGWQERQQACYALTTDVPSIGSRGSGHGPQHPNP